MGNKFNFTDNSKEKLNIKPSGYVHYHEMVRLKIETDNFLNNLVDGLTEEMITESNNYIKQLEEQFKSRNLNTEENNGYKIQINRHR